MSEEREQRRVSRRTIAKGAAWAVPAVPLIVATPAYAASGGGPTVTVSDGCKLPGNSCGNVFVKGYVFDVLIENNTGKDIYLYDQAGFEITFDETNPDLTLFFEAAVYATGPNAGVVVTFPLLIPAGESVALIFNAGENGNSANQSITGSISIPWGHTPTPPDPDNHPNVVDEFSIPYTPPIQNPDCQVILPPDCGKAA